MIGAPIVIPDFFMRHPAAVGASASCLSGPLCDPYEPV